MVILIRGLPGAPLTREFTFLLDNILERGKIHYIYQNYRYRLLVEKLQEKENKYIKNFSSKSRMGSRGAAHMDVNFKCTLVNKINICYINAACARVPPSPGRRHFNLQG